MSDYLVAILAASAAIISSFLTSFLTYLFLKRENKRNHQLKWLEDKFNPAIEFMGKVLSIASGFTNIDINFKDAYTQIHNFIVSPSKENNIFYIALSLDPDRTGLEDMIFSTMTYANIMKGPMEFNDYFSRLHTNFIELTTEYRKERTLVLRGKSIENIIYTRKKRIEKFTNEISKLLFPLQKYKNSIIEMHEMIGKLRFINKKNLEYALSILKAENDPMKLDRLKDAKNEFKKRGWL